MSTNNGVTPSSYDLIILVSKNIKRFLERKKIIVYESILANFHTAHNERASTLKLKFGTARVL